MCQARRQWEMSLVSLFGTAFAIFLVMVVVVVNRVDHAPFPPVSDRARLLYARGVDISFGNGSRSAAYSPAFAMEIYAGLPGSDAMAMYSWLDECDAAVRGSGAFDVNLRRVGGDYWKIFDFRFLAGAPFRPAAGNRKYDAATPVVISESVARRLFGSAGDDVVGREVLISHAPRKVCGVVAEVTPLADMAYSQVWIPFEGPVATAVPVDFNDFYGECQAVVRIAPGSSLSAVKAEAGRRYEAAARRLAAGGYELNTHFQPHTLAEFKSTYGTNSDPAEETQWRTWLVYAILLIVPAINLSGMTHSFLRRRRTELGVRRAFGSTRGRIIMDVFAENLPCHPGRSDHRARGGMDFPVAVCRFVCCGKDLGDCFCLGHSGAGDVVQLERIRIRGAVLPGAQHTERGCACVFGRENEPCGGHIGP